MRSRKNKAKGKNSVYYKFVSILLLVVSLFFVGIIHYIDLLPNKYFNTLLIAVVIFDLFNILLLNNRRFKKKPKKFLTSCSLASILIMTFISFYVYKTLMVLENSADSKYKTGNYSIIVLNSSSYNKLSDLEGKAVGYFKNSTGIEKAKEELTKKAKVDLETYDSSDKLVKALLDKSVKAILLEDSIRGVISEEFEDFESSIKVIYSFTVKDEVKSTVKEVSVTEEAFAVYISGIDTYGQISSVSRSDVNIVMVVNPNTHQILLISIPRDYYVQLHDTTGVKDKLTHAGIYGIDMSVKTIEDLLDMDINYYIKVNFTSIIDMVDALGGVDIYSEYTFVSYSDFNFKKGMNHVNGEQALDFVRTRKAFTDGDRQRGKNQQALIEALVRKITNKSIIVKYNSLLNAINGKYQTNIGMKKITSLIKMQLSDMPTWNITSYSLTGTDSKNYTYTCNQLLYVMNPDKDSVSLASSLVKKVLNGEVLDNSYENIGGEVNKVNKVIVKEDNTKNNDEKAEEEKQTEKMDEGELKKEEDQSNNDKIENDSEIKDDELQDSDIMGDIENKDPENSNE